MFPNCCIHEMWYKPLCDVAQTSDCGVYLFLTLNISPLCDVAQTSDCGMHCLYCLLQALYVVSPRRPTVALLFCIFPLEESFRHSFGTRIIIPHFPLEESFRHSFGTCIIIPHFPLEESFRHSLGTQYFTLNYFNHMSASWCSYLFVTDVWSHNKPEHVFDLLYPCS